MKKYKIIITAGCLIIPAILLGVWISKTSSSPLSKQVNIIQPVVKKEVLSEEQESTKKEKKIAELRKEISIMEMMLIDRIGMDYANRVKDMSGTQDWIDEQLVKLTTQFGLTEEENLLWWDEFKSIAPSEKESHKQKIQVAYDQYNELSDKKLIPIGYDEPSGVLPQTEVMKDSQISADRIQFYQDILDELKSLQSQYEQSFKKHPDGLDPSFGNLINKIEVVRDKIPLYKDIPSHEIDLVSPLSQYATQLAMFVPYEAMLKKNQEKANASKQLFIERIKALK